LRKRIWQWRTKEYRAEARFQRVSPQKARLVLDLIKGRGVQEALDTAAFTKKRIAPVIHKLLTSAVDNAKYVAGEQGIDLDVDNLYVKNGNRQRRAAHEAHPPCAHGARVPLSAQAHAHHAVGGRARARRALVTKVEEPAVAPPNAAKAKKGAPEEAALRPRKPSCEGRGREMQRRAKKAARQAKKKAAK
jgi:large subunit ribosomal protein L22